MMKETISKSVGNISTRHIEEAASDRVKRVPRRPVWAKLGGIAACFALVLAVGGILFPFHSGLAAAAYTCGTNEEITAAGAVIDTGKIGDNGEMTGHPLMFYLSGKNIQTVRFSCKNQQINFTDWTEKRDEYGNAQNFTVPYGEDEREYGYLTIDWIPNGIIRKLTDDPSSSIASLPAEMREDIIVMEITFANGKTATKAVTVSLLDDGTFFASYNDHEITPEDDFVARIDSERIPRDILYEQGANAGGNEALSFEEVDGTVPGNSLDAAEMTARDHYTDTVFEVVSMELKSQSAEEVSFSVCVSKGGIVQEPDRTIYLQLINGDWEVVNEGY